MNNQLHEIFNEIKKNKNILILPHINPDGDALGSCFGLKYALLEYFPEKKIKIVFNKENEYLDFLGLTDNWGDWGNKSYLLITLDTANEERINKPNNLDPKKIINIDHHISNTYYGDLNYVMPEASSACEIIAIILEKWFKNINNRSKMALYTGIITDSNRFLYNSTSKKTLKIASWLYVDSLNTQYIYNKLYLKPKLDFDILQFIYKKIKIKDSIGYYIINKEDISQLKKESFEFKKYISLLNGYKDIKIWFSVIWKKEDQIYKISLRSREYNLIDIANSYNGGGHKYACGLQIKDIKELEVIINKLKELL